MSVDNKVPEIRFKGFSGEWVENDLGGLIDIRSAARVHKEQWTEAGVPFFRTSDVVSIYKGKENTKAYISHEVYQSLSEKIGTLTTGDILITGGGSIGIPYLVPNDNPLYFKDADLLWLKNNKKFDGYFLYAFFFSKPFKKHIKSISHTGTIAHYTIEQAKATPINTCGDEEQTHIGNYFQKLDTLINQHQQKHDKLINIKKAMLEKMFPKQGETIPEIRFKGFSGDWKKLTLGDLGSVAMNKRIFKHQTTIVGEIPFFKIGTFGKKADAFISKALFYEYKEKYPYPVAGDLLLSASGSIGRVVEYKGEEQYFQDSNIIWLKHDGKIDNAFLKVFYSIVKWSGLEGSTIKRLYNKNILDTEISTPDRQEQTAIGNYFQKLDSLINQHQQQIAKLNNIKLACLSKMFI
ncbi:restriction endonuclease subunit S [Serratia sp. UGAL515B_01]|uniref:restriction endonuclease subunit S n=1 Tax=Serratia sp. UGAL515B_01 TaxID=2986763 RepID=UPI0029539B3B|nr:restriction endonuclease subunit S [Serratia sp. UGAL515B_01]WON77434.1 restriction endonuclease subunit S [Serratia sp. UGAL515B_01]